MSNIWIVTRGSKSEGGEIQAVCDSYELAVNRALEQRTYYPGGWMPYDLDPGEGLQSTSWDNGCDVVTVEEWSVEATVRRVDANGKAVR